MRNPRTLALSLTSMILALFALQGCSSKSNPAAPSAPSVQASADSLDFGGTAVSATADRTVNVSNSGGTSTRLTAAVSADAAGVGYAIVSGGGAFDLAAGASHPIVVRFAPTVGGHAVGSLALGTGAPTVKLGGDGTTVSFATDVAPTFTSRGCLNCHAGFSGGASAIVNVTSSNHGPAKLIKPYDWANSVLYAKIANLGTYGGAMPPGTTGVSATEKTKWSTWIMEGAHNN